MTGGGRKWQGDRERMDGHGRGEAGRSDGLNSERNLGRKLGER